MTRFGPSGNSKSFYAAGYTATEQSAKYTRSFGLNIFEYSFGRGVTMRSEKAASIGAAFAAEGVELSVHAPYYINFTNPDPDATAKSVMYVLQSLKKVKIMGGSRVVMHPGSQGKAERGEAMRVTLDNLKRLTEALDENGYGEDIKICIETMGKQGQMGTVREICEFCALDSRFYPCIDFGHVNAREQGILTDKAAYSALFTQLYDNMELEKVQNMHIHFSMIAYGGKGELHHLDFEDNKFGPPFEPLMEILHEQKLDAYCICESAGNQIEDAAAMMKYYSALSL